LRSFQADDVEKIWRIIGSLITLRSTSRQTFKNSEATQAETAQLMDSEDDAEIAMRLAVLDSISRHIVASTEQTGKIWHIKVEDEIFDRGSTDSIALAGPEVMKFAYAAAAACDGFEKFEDALCDICRGVPELHAAVKLVFFGAQNPR
jgi:hypothetical protein